MILTYGLCLPKILRKEEDEANIRWLESSEILMPACPKQGEVESPQTQRQDNYFLTTKQ